jgi:hypothetical protein
MAWKAAAVLMNSEFATTVAVAVPVILLALGAEARELDKRTRAQRDWPSSFNAKWYSEAEQALKSFPDASPDWTVEQLRTQLVHYQQWRGQWVRDRGSSPIFLLGALQLRVYLATVLWALTIASLSVTEVWTLVWLSSHHPDAGDWSELAWLSVVSCALGVVLLFTVPTLRLLWFQVQTPRDLEPPDSYLRLLERKFGLSADASREERRAWLEGYHHGPLP